MGGSDGRSAPGRTPLSVRIDTATIGPRGFRVARALFREYARSLPVDLAFQGFEEEVATLPGTYAPPGGGVWIARVGGRPAGCVAVHPLTPKTAELKRLYVRPRFRRRGIGRALLERAVGFARRRGYEAIRLDTLATMTIAMDLYRSLGFRRIPAYRYNPVPGSSFWELRFRTPS